MSTIERITVRMSRASRAARLLNTASAILAAGVATDSTAEHYRAGFHNRAMFVAPAVSSMALVAAARAAADPAPAPAAQTLINAASVVTGCVGLALHATNVSRRPGGWSSTSVFNGAPLAAPLAITMAGALGLAASRVTAGSADRWTVRALGCLVAVGLVGTSAEATALHFRGAFQNPLMYAPVVLPPVAAAALAATSLNGRRAGTTRALLRATTLLGMGGTFLHAWGIHRRMGGWRNWRQNMLAGPPLPAPPAFTGLALAGLAALHLLEGERHE